MTKFHRQTTAPTPIWGQLRQCSSVKKRSNEHPSSLNIRRKAQSRDPADGYDFRNTYK
ncbi:hypothetical protein WN55_00295 [Dufourea novaeangliae]|uniref:Uncharacterized protein n=1 Tax=Dufourea novaeangliae TaxID=178035 RepID=A0A154PBZ3_DUFNO|nr:hypothetical protein WN55_00295 [Dufourea novaeangliae]